MSNGKRHRIQPVVLRRSRELRRPQTPAEIKLWYHLRHRRLNGLKFRRQHAVGPFVTDFYCPEHRLLIEVDGDTHDLQAEYDANRTDWLNEQGYRVLRFTNHDVYHSLPAVLEAILNACAGSLET